MISGYARVSPDGQSVAAQVAALTAAGAGKVFRKTASGAKADRTQLRQALATLAACDLIRTRTSDGREHAKARGVNLDRKPKLTTHQQREAMKRRDRGGWRDRHARPTTV